MALQNLGRDYCMVPHNGWYFYIYLWQYKGVGNLLEILQTRIDRNIFSFFVWHMKGRLTFVLHTFYGKMCFFSYCLTEQDFFLLQWVSSLSCSCKGTPVQFLLSWLYDPSLTCSQSRLGKQSGPGADEEWLHETTSYPVVVSEDAAHGRKAVRLWDRAAQSTQIYLAREKGDPWGALVVCCLQNALQAHFSHAGSCYQLSKIPLCNLQRKVQHTKHCKVCGLLWTWVCWCGWCDLAEIWEPLHLSLEAV